MTGKIDDKIDFEMPNPWIPVQDPNDIFRGGRIYDASMKIDLPPPQPKPQPIEDDPIDEGLQYLLDLPQIGDFKLLAFLFDELSEIGNHVDTVDEGDDQFNRKGNRLITNFMMTMADQNQLFKLSKGYYLLSHRAHREITHPLAKHILSLFPEIHELIPPSRDLLEQQRLNLEMELRSCKNMLVVTKKRLSTAIREHTLDRTFARIEKKKYLLPEAIKVYEAKILSLTKELAKIEAELKHADEMTSKPTLRLALIDDRMNQIWKLMPPGELEVSEFVMERPWYYMTVKPNLATPPQSPNVPTSPRIPTSPAVLQNVPSSPNIPVSPNVLRKVLSSPVIAASPRTVPSSPNVVRNVAASPRTVIRNVPSSPKIAAPPRTVPQSPTQTSARRMLQAIGST